MYINVTNAAFMPKVLTELQRVVSAFHPSRAVDYADVYRRIAAQGVVLSVDGFEIDTLPIFSNPTMTEYEKGVELVRIVTEKLRPAFADDKNPMGLAQRVVEIVTDEEFMEIDSAAVAASLPAEFAPDAPRRQSIALDVGAGQVSVCKATGWGAPGAPLHLGTQISHKFVAAPNCGNLPTRLACTYVQWKHEGCAEVMNVLGGHEIAGILGRIRLFLQDLFARRGVAGGFYVVSAGRAGMVQASNAGAVREHVFDARYQASEGRQSSRQWKIDVATRQIGDLTAQLVRTHPIGVPDSQRDELDPELRAAMAARLSLLRARARQEFASQGNLGDADRLGRLPEIGNWRRAAEVAGGAAAAVAVIMEAHLEAMSYAAREHGGLQSSLDTVALELADSELDDRDVRAAIVVFSQIAAEVSLYRERLGTAHAVSALTLEAIGGGRYLAGRCLDRRGVRLAEDDEDRFRPQAPIYGLLGVEPSVRRAIEAHLPRQ